MPRTWRSERDEKNGWPGVRMLCQDERSGVGCKIRVAESNTVLAGPFHTCTFKENNLDIKGINYREERKKERKERKKEKERTETKTPTSNLYLFIIVCLLLLLFVCLFLVVVAVCTNSLYKLY